MKNDMKNDKNDINDIRQEIADLKASLQALGDAKTAGETLSAGEILRIYERLNKLEASAETVADNERDKTDREDNKPDKEDDKPDIERNKPDPRHVSAMAPDITQAGNKTAGDKQTGGDKLTAEIEEDNQSEDKQTVISEENKQGDAYPNENTPAKSVRNGNELLNSQLNNLDENNPKEKIQINEQAGNELVGNKLIENEPVENKSVENEQRELNPVMEQPGIPPQWQVEQGENANQHTYQQHQEENAYQHNQQHQQYQQNQLYQQNQENPWHPQNQLYQQNIQMPETPEFPENFQGMQPMPVNGRMPPTSGGYAANGYTASGYATNGYTAGRMPPAYIIKQNKGKQSGGISETSVGKYVIGVLASILILLGVAMGARTFWEVIPGAAKFAILLAVGAGVAAVGYVKARENEQADGFWPSVSATGAAIVFIAITSGMLIWTLYGPILLGIMLLAWFLGSLSLSSGLQSRVYYIVSYIGAIISLMLGMMEVIGMLGGATIGFAMLAVTMSAAGLAVQKKDRILPGLNFAFFLITASLCQGVIAQWTNYVKNGYDYAINSFWSPPSDQDVIILICIQLAAATAAVIESQEILNSDKVWKKIIMVMAAISASSTMTAALMQPIPGHEGGIIPGGAAAVMLLAAFAAIGAIMKFKDKLGLYVISIAAPSIALLSRVYSEDGPVSPMLLPAVVIAMGAAYLSMAGDNEEDEFEGNSPGTGFMRAAGIACYLAYLSALSVFREQHLGDRDLPYILSAAVPMAAAGLVMYRKARLQPLQLNRMEPFILSLLALEPLHALARHYESGFRIPSILPTAAVILLFVVNRMLDLQEAQGAEGRLYGWRKTDKELTDVLYVVALVIMHFSVYLSTVSFFGMRNVTPLEKSAATCAIAVMSAAVLYESAEKKHWLQAILSVIFINMNMAYIVGLWCEGQHKALLTSVVGIFTATAFILIGFKKKFKPIRVLGLAAMIIYVLKISVFDISLAYSKGINAVLLVLGGIACFAISYVYSRISQKQDDEDD